MNDPQPTLLHQGPVATIRAALVDGKPVAWKVFPAKFDRRTLSCVERERAKLGALSAPILPVDAVERWDGRHALRMELGAESLAARIRRTGPLAVPDTVELGHAVARALAAAHEVGVLHGAVNPNNVLFRASGRPVLADFGVAVREAFPRDPAHGLEYLAPETMRTSTVSEHTDLYGLGTVLHVALTGRSPHPSRLGEQPGERVLRVLRTPVPAISRPDVPIGLSTVIARLLATEPSNRPADSARVATQLADMLPSQPDGDTQRINIPAMPGVARPNRRWLVSGGVALVAMAAVGLCLAPRTSPVSRTAAPEPVSTPASLVTTGVDLAAPEDRTDHVVLNWTSQRTLDFVVVVEENGQPDNFLLAQRDHTMTVPVDPARRYCFVIRGTDGNQVYESRPAAIRGAECHQ